MHEPLDGGDGRSRLEPVHAERIEHFLARGRTRGSEERRAILEPVAALIAAPPAPIDADGARLALAPAAWLELGTDGSR